MLKEINDIDKVIDNVNVENLNIESSVYSLKRTTLNKS